MNWWVVRGCLKAVDLVGGSCVGSFGAGGGCCQQAARQVMQ